MNKVNIVIAAILTSCMLSVANAEDYGAWEIGGGVHNGYTEITVGYDFLKPKTHQFREDALYPNGMTGREMSGGGSKGFWSGVASFLKMDEHPILWTVGASVATFLILENNTSMDLIDGIGKDNGSDANKYVRRAKELEKQERAEAEAAAQAAEVAAILAALEALEASEGE